MEEEPSVAKESKEDADKAEAERLKKEAADKAEAERLEKEAADKAEAERLEQEAAEKAEAERLEQEAAEKAEAERLEKETKAKAEADRIAAQKASGIFYRKQQGSSGIKLTLKQTTSSSGDCEGIAIIAKNRSGSSSIRVGLDALFSVLKHAGPADSDLMETAQTVLEVNEWGEKDGKQLSCWPSLWDLFAQPDILRAFAELCAAKVVVTTSRGQFNIKFESGSVAKEKIIASLKRKLELLTQQQASNFSAKDF